MPRRTGGRRSKMVRMRDKNVRKLLLQRLDQGVGQFALAQDGEPGQDAGGVDLGDRFGLDQFLPDHLEGVCRHPLVVHLGHGRLVVALDVGDVPQVALVLRDDAVEPARLALVIGSSTYAGLPAIPACDASVNVIAAARRGRLALGAPIGVAAAHEVVGREIEFAGVVPLTARERPDVALVVAGESSEHALGLIDKIVREAACPVIVLLHATDPAFVKAASKRGVFAHISDADVDDWQSSIDIVLRRFAEYHDLRGAFGRRALIERAKGILMERHSIDEQSAFEMLRERSRIDNRKLIDLATAVVDGHRLLPQQTKVPLRI